MIYKYPWNMEYSQYILSNFETLLLSLASIVLSV